MSSSCLDTIYSHVSIREYLEEDIPSSDLDKILRASQRAPSGWNLQPYTIIVVKNTEKKKKLADLLGGQNHIANSSVFLVFIVDYAKIVNAVEEHGKSLTPLLSHFAEALIDIGISAGWAALVAESLGYGVTFIAVYEDPCRVAEILETPKYTIPVLGLTIGKPREKPRKRPRQPLDQLTDIDTYSDYRSKAKSVLEVYGDKADRVFNYIFSRNKYYDKAHRNILECLSTTGFRTTY